MAHTVLPAAGELDSLDNEEATLDPYDPENEKADARANSLIEKYLRKAKHQRFSFERTWFQSILYMAGNHWIQWHRDEKRWVQKKGPSWYPKPVTNIYASKIDDNIASLTQQPPEMQWAPETADAEDQATARVAQRIDDLIGEETGRARKARERATWLVLTGNVFIESYYDSDPRHGTAFLQHEECHDCGYAGPPLDFRAQGGKCPQCESENVFGARQRTGAACPECGHETSNPDDAYTECPECAFAAQFKAAVPPEGMEGSGLEAMPPPAAPVNGMPPPPMESPETAIPGENVSRETAAVGVMQPVRSQEPVGEDVPKGRMADRTLSPFEAFFDHLHVQELTEDGGMRWFLRVDMIDPDEAKAVYGFEPHLAVSKATAGVSDTSLSTLYLESLAVVNDGIGESTRSGRSSAARTYGTGDSKAGILRETLYMLPPGGELKPEDFYDGLYAVRLNGSGGKIVERKPLPYHDHDGKPFISVVHIRFKKMPGRAWGKTVATDLIPLQDNRNMTEAEMMMNERRMGNGVWLIPEASVLRAPTGEPGEQVYYHPRDVGTGSQTVRPERLPGVPPSDYYLKRIEMLDNEMERLSGSFGVAHGEAPKGITAASALALLGERQQRQVSPQIHAWEIGHEQVAKQQMNIFREYAADTRVHAVMGKNSDWKIEKWSSADLSGRINVRVKVGSSMPRSSATRRAQIEGLVRMQALSPANPEQNRRILEEFGEEDVAGDYTIDVADAQKEQDRFLMAWQGEPGGELPEFRPLFDNSQVHLAEHTKFGKTDEYRKIERLARQKDISATAFKAYWESHMMQHIEALAAQAATPEAGAEGESREKSPREGKTGQQGAGRPADSGAVLNRGARAPGEEATREVLEPRSPIAQ